MSVQIIRLYSENNDFQHIETLRRNRSKRKRSGEFFVEGVRLINLARQHNWEINAYVYSRDKRLSDWADGILKNSTAKRHYELPVSLMEKLSQKDDTSELLALIAIPDDDLSRIQIPTKPLLVILDRISNPGNLGAIIRSCDALGVDGVIMTGHSADPYAPETIRASAGSFFGIPVIHLESHKKTQIWLNNLKRGMGEFQIVGTSAKAETPIREINFANPTAILIGSENHGLSANYRSLSDFMVKIPMVGSASSINVACATSIILYEVGRQRRKVS